MCSDFLMSTYGISWLGLSLLVLDFIHLGFLLPMHSLCRFGSSLLVSGLSRLGSSMFVLDFIHLGFFMSLQAFIQSDPVLLVYGIACLDSSTFALDLVHIDSSTLLHGHARCALLCSPMDLHGWTFSCRSWTLVR